jgi:predicted choloylglycine hydrolase
MRNDVPKEISFIHTVIEGTPYEVGRLQGEQLKKDKRRAGFLIPTLPFLDAYSQREAQKALDYIEKYCPGLREEIQGAADGFGVPVEQVAFLGGKNKKSGSSTIPVGESASNTNQPRDGNNCSQLVVLPSATEDSHLYVAQNTDCGLTDLDMRLCTTRVRGKPAHIGFSDMIFGRSVGINEHGLCVTTSWGAPMMWPRCKGLPYFAVVRALLDRCRNVDEALHTLASIPVAWCTNFIVSDGSGVAALIEVAGEDRAVKRIGKGSSDHFLCATNHFTFPELHAYSTNRRRESVIRRQTIESRMGAAVPQANKETIRDLFSGPFPHGVCLHHYGDGLGTLWSTIFDPTEIPVEVCFGAPSSEKNQWRTFGLQDPIGMTQYKAHFPDQAANPGFWERLPPRSDG